MIRTLKRWLIWIVLTAVAALALVRTGRRIEKAEGRADRAEANTKAAQAAKDNRYELENTDDQHLVNILSGKLHER